MKNAAAWRRDTAAFLQKRVVRAGVWTAVGYGGQQVVRLGGHIVLARLLFPEAFGLMALVAVLQQGITMFSDIGIAQAVIQKRRGDDPAFLDTAWTLQVCRGFVIWLVVLALSWPFAAFYEEPLLAAIIPVAGLAAIIRGFQSIGIVTASRQLILHRLTMIEIISQIGGVGVMIGWAMLSPTVWALVAGGLVTAILTTSVSHIALPGHRARLQLERASVSEIVNFGRWITLSSGISFLGSMGDRLILGKLFPIGFLGIYSIASNLEKVPETLLRNTGNRVVFPALSEAYRKAPDTVRARVQRMRLYMGMTGAFAAAFLAARGSEIVHILYDERYRDAGWILELLGIQVGLVALEVSAGSALLAVGDSRSIFWINAYRFGWTVGIVLPLAYYLGAHEAIVGIVCMGVGSIMLANVLLARHNLYTPQIDFAAMLVAITSYVCFDRFSWIVG
ncbi:MAG: oligosaccharide flippase family protein [Gammaproteobacteria bacterium]|nr:oligosaccharide flippase family protein [Gammaproteobacteria bacterium]